jgi:hypothetical protein
MRHRNILFAATLWAASAAAGADCPVTRIFNSADPEGSHYVSNGCVVLIRISGTEPAVQVTHPFPGSALADIAFDDASELVVAQSTEGALSMSSDRGHSWMPLSRPVLAGPGPGLVAVSGGADAGMWFASASGLWFRSNSDGTWNSVPLPIESARVTALAVQPDDPGLIFVGDASGWIHTGEMTAGRIFSWNSRQPVDRPVRAFLFDMAEMASVHAVVEGSAESDGPLISSADNGATWVVNADGEKHARVTAAASRAKSNCTPSFSPRRFRLNNKEYNLSVRVTFPRMAKSERKSCQWFASRGQTQAWLDVGPHSGEGDGVINLHVSANRTSPPKDRSGAASVRVRLGTQGDLINYSIPVSQKR